MKYRESRFPSKINDFMNDDGSLNIIESNGKKFGGKILVEAYKGNEDLFGKKASDLQNIDAVDGILRGSLNYVEGYTGFSSKPEEQQGHYIAVRVLTCLEGVDLYCQMGAGKEVKLDSDGIVVFITWERNLPIVGRAKKNGEVVAEYKIGVNCEFLPKKGE